MRLQRFHGFVKQLHPTVPIEPDVLECHRLWKGAVTVGRNQLLGQIEQQKTSALPGCTLRREGQRERSADNGFERVPACLPCFVRVQPALSRRPRDDGSRARRSGRVTGWGDGVDNNPDQPVQGLVAGLQNQVVAAVVPSAPITRKGP